MNIRAANGQEFFFYTQQSLELGQEIHLSLEEESVQFFREEE
jgi:positive regulator of sigma E activity